MPAAVRRPRLLYLAFFFPPSRASGVHRARATANYFAEQGWDVTVLHAPQRFYEVITGGVDEALTATVDPRVTVARPPMSYFTWEADLRHYGWFRGNMPNLARRWYAWQQRHVFPEKYLSWGAAAVREGWRRHRQRRFDLVLATGNPFASFAAAHVLGRITKAPYVVDYRDSWTLDLFSGEDAFEPGHPARKWERRVLASAAGALFVNEALRSWHAERYPEAAQRMRVVLNGWDPDVLPDVESPRREEDSAPSFAYAGTLTAAQPVEAMLDGFRRMRETGERGTLDLYGHLGFFARHESRLRSEIGLDEPRGGVAFRGPVSKAEIGRVYAASDVLVFLAGGSKYVTSGKVFEYMATGKPIVSVHENGSAAEELLRGYPLWFKPETLEPRDVAAAMIEAARAARETDPLANEQARKYAESFTRYRALEPFERWARSLVEARR